jgi:hypothetical protein
MTRAEKIKRNRDDKLIEQAYYATCSGIQIDILDIPKVFEAGRAELARGTGYDALKLAVRAYVDTIRKN